MSYRIFTLSPGSTSTKLAVFNGTEQVFKANVQHDPEVLKTFARVSQQKPYRVETILNLLKENGIEIADMDAFAAYSGGLPLPAFSGRPPRFHPIIAHIRRKEKYFSAYYLYL